MFCLERSTYGIKTLIYKKLERDKKYGFVFWKSHVVSGAELRGVNNIISCLAFIFNSKELEPEDIYDETELAVLKMIFFKENTRYKLKITASALGEVRYYMRNSKNWREITKDEYLKFISQIPFFMFQEIWADNVQIFSSVFLIFWWKTMNMNRE